MRGQGALYGPRAKKDGLGARTAKRWFTAWHFVRGAALPAHPSGIAAKRALASSPRAASVSYFISYVTDTISTSPAASIVYFIGSVSTFTRFSIGLPSSFQRCVTKNGGGFVVPCGST
jgi:hypothetical protein